MKNEGRNFPFISNEKKSIHSFILSYPSMTFVERRRWRENAMIEAALYSTKISFETLSFGEGGT